LNDVGEARRLGESGRRAVAERFTADAMAAGVLDVLQRVTADQGARHGQ